MKAVPPSRYVVFLAIALGGCAIDLATKSWIFRVLPYPCGEPWWLWQGVFGFQTSLNEGALFGFGQGGWAIFSALSVLAAFGILYWLFCLGAAQQWPLTTALACVTAGILGNLYDRVGLPGLTWPYGHPTHPAGTPVHAVRDWILVMIGKWPWPTFNVADSLLVCGAALLIGHAPYEGRAKHSDSA